MKRTDGLNARTGISCHRVSVGALLVAIGIVFGDIGTSPLYVMKAILNANSEWSADYIIGAVSCIIWTLTLQTTVKYVLIALKADNKGEGGIFALYALLRRHRSRWLFVLAAVGASALVADGVITPAMTVTSAIEGLADLAPGAPVLPITLIIITAIFFVQKFGTIVIGRGFGPFMLVWFLTLGVLGAANIGDYLPILNAFNPLCAVKMLVNYPGWFFILGAVFLCTTGAEALYSDLGHCGRYNITYSWLFVKIMLILNYLGQGAWIISHKGAIVAGVNPFYAIMPGWMLGFGIVLATGAAIIASQALLSGSFTIFSEAMNLKFWPWLKVNYPTTLRGQLYIPAVNWFLYAGCVVTVLIFGSSSHMEGAYGLAITITMIMTTILLGFYMKRKGAPTWMVGLFVFFFMTIEGAFFVSNLFKFVHGGWFTVLIGGIVCGVMIIWYKAEELRNRYIDYSDLRDSIGIISDIKNDSEIPKYASNVIYISRSPQNGLVESKLLYSIINKRPKRADHYWVIRIVESDAPETLQYSVDTLIPGTLFCVDLILGFRVRPRVSVYLRQIVDDLVASGELDLLSGYPSLKKHGVAGDFRFIILYRIFSAASSCTPAASLIMSLHEKLRRIGLSDEDAFGLDTSNVTVENVPLIINNATDKRIMRV